MLKNSTAIEAAELRRGVAYGVTAYLLWGVFPLYFKAIAEVAAPEVLAHRVVWSCALLGLVVLVRGAGRKILSAVAAPKTLGVLLASTLLVCTNWLVFIHAVLADRVLESSLGYFINPLVSVLLGVVFLGERLRPVQGAAIALAAAGVAVQTWMLGQFPTVALVLAGTFGLYGLMRKLTGVDGFTSLTVEMALVAPVAVGFMIHLELSGKAAFLSGSGGLDALLLLAGVVTATPLLLFGAAMGRLRLATMGLLQYIVPTSHFGLAVFAFGEPFGSAHLLSFALIWSALAVYSWDSLRSTRRSA